MPYHDLRTPQGRMTMAEYDERMRAARQRAEWELGSASWAGVVVAAFMEPDADEDALRREQAQQG